MSAATSKTITDSPRAAPIAVEVLGENELVDSLQRGDRHYRSCISIGNPKPFLRFPAPGERIHPLIGSSFENVLRLSFFDLEEPVHVKVKGFSMKRLPDALDAKRVLRFVERTRDSTDGYTIHCWAGVSRSTAVALAVLFLLRGEEPEAAAELTRIRPIAMPNRLLVRHFDALLGTRFSSRIDGMHAARLETLQVELSELMDSLIEDFESAD